MGQDPTPMTDKERLARIETEITHLKGDIGEMYRYLREEFSKMVSLQIGDLQRRLEVVEKDIIAKASCADTTELKTRVVSIEKWIWKALGALAVLSLLAPYILSLLGLTKTQG